MYTSKSSLPLDCKDNVVVVLIITSLFHVIELCIAECNAGESTASFSAVVSWQICMDFFFFRESLLYLGPYILRSSECWIMGSILDLVRGKMRSIKSAARKLARVGVSRPSLTILQKNIKFFVK